MIGDPEEAADITQDVFISFYTRLQQGTKIHHVKSWLCRAAINRSIDKHRYTNRFCKIDDNANSLQSESELEDVAGSDELSFAVAKLKSEERSLVVLYSEGFSYKEIAETTGIKLTSVGKTLSRILKKLEKELIKVKI